jgi:hypothetical protein
LLAGRGLTIKGVEARAGIEPAYAELQSTT